MHFPCYQYLTISCFFSNSFMLIKPTVLVGIYRYRAKVRGTETSFSNLNFYLTPPVVINRHIDGLTDWRTSLRCFGPTSWKLLPKMRKRYCCDTKNFNYLLNTKFYVLSTILVTTFRKRNWLNNGHDSLSDMLESYI